MTKTMYYRVTDPKTMKQSWVKVPGVKTNGELLFIDQPEWKFVRLPDVVNSMQVVYKRTRKVEE